MKDQRCHSRYRLRWPATLVLGDDVNRAPLVECRVHDLSIGGVSVLSDFHLRGITQLKVVLLPPPLVSGQERRIITAHSKLVYSVHSDEHMCFRAGLQFVRFEADGRDLLADRLARHSPIFEKVSI